MTAELAESNHLGVKKQRPSDNDTLAKASPARLKVEPTVQSSTPCEDYLDFKRAARRNRKQRLKYTGRPDSAGLEILEPLGLRVVVTLDQAAQAIWKRLQQ